MVALNEGGHKLFCFYMDLKNGNKKIHVDFPYNMEGYRQFLSIKWEITDNFYLNKFHLLPKYI